MINEEEETALFHRQEEQAEVVLAYCASISGVQLSSSNAHVTRKLALSIRMGPARVLRTQPQLESCSHNVISLHRKALDPVQSLAVHDAMHVYLTPKAIPGVS